MPMSLWGRSLAGWQRTPLAILDPSLVILSPPVSRSCSGSVSDLVSGVSRDVVDGFQPSPYGRWKAFRLVASDRRLIMYRS